MENLEDAASGNYDIQPQKTLRERQYSPAPLVVIPEYKGDFLKKLKDQPGFYGKPIMQASNPENLWDFNWPSEWLKHQERPHPRNLVDDWYSINSPGPSDQGDGNQTLNEYWNNRQWMPWDAPEISEDKLDRMYDYVDPKKRVVKAYLNFMGQSGPDVHQIIASFLLNYIPIDLEFDSIENIRIAKLLKDFLKARITTKTRGVRQPGNGNISEGSKGEMVGNVPGVTVRLIRAEPKQGRWSFATTSGKDRYRTVFQFIPYKNIRDTNKLHVRVACTCPSWLFWGAQYHAMMEDYLYGPLRPKFAPPRIRDPKGEFLVCKHVLACLPLVSRYKLGEMPSELKKKIKKAPKYEITKEIPEEELHIPARLVPIGRKSKIKDIVDQWEEFPRRRKKWINSLNKVEELEFLAHRFPETSTALVARRLRELAKEPLLKKKAEKALEEIVEIEVPEMEKPELPADLKKYDKDPNLQETLKDLSKNRNLKVIMDLTDPDQLAYLAYNLYDNHEVISDITKRLNQIAKNVEDQMEENRQKAKHWLREIY